MLSFLPLSPQDSTTYNRVETKIFFDTSYTKLSIPENEKKLFEEYDYSESASSSFNPLTALISYILQKFFDEVSSQKIENARKIFIWIIVIVCLFIIYKILKRYGFGIPLLNEEKNRKGAPLFSDINKPLKYYDFEKIIQDYISKKDYRSAFRWAFISLLHELEKKQHITFEPQKTINDFKKMVSGKAFSQGFSEICLLFEYVWYGKFEINEITFSSILDKTNSLKGSITK
ncbi:MAG: hypothetical protein N3F09_09415 [Bacteroidia bacterium]|nr:hypothetical protein [Bacteroidia bacterium]